MYKLRWYRDKFVLIDKERVFFIGGNMDFEKCLEEFTRYVNNYKMKNINIKLKYDHSIRVMKLMEKIATFLGLTQEEIDLAKIIGLLHDIGRFEQLAKFKSFKDANMDHGDYGIEVLFQNNLIRNFITSSKYDQVIKMAIKYHNKFKIPGNLNKRNEFYAKIIRDADKIDIFKVLNQKKWSGFVSAPSKEVLEKFLNKETIENELVKNGTDTTIARMAFIYDLNYNASFKVLRQTKYLEKWLDNIKVGDNERDNFEKLKTILLNKLKEGVKDAR